MSVILETSIGDITIDLYIKERPNCSQNFLKLCKLKYYNFSLFHSIQRNFMAQTGDPTGTGSGGESVFERLYGEQARYFDAEIKPRIKHTKVGTLSMVNNGDSKHGSQFFLTLAESVDYLDGVHTVFGEVAEGHDVLSKLNETITDKHHRPYQDVRIMHTVVLDDPFPDPEALVSMVPPSSPAPTVAILESDRIGVGEGLDDTEGLTNEEIEERKEETESRANAQILEMVGDLPTADAEAPDNVLFVCKLNPVTTSEDLEIIFSRFGKIDSCEVIKEQKTGESLQYAFIEFSNPSECENAYFKMDNVLIDDRRIHVDFSQSVAKLKKGHPGAKKAEEEEGEERPKYRIKDLTRKDDKYGLVFEDEIQPSSHKKKKKKHTQSDSEPEKKKKYAQPDSDSDSNKRKNKHEYNYSEKTKYRHDVVSSDYTKKKNNYTDNDSDSNRQSSYKARQRSRSSSEEDNRTSHSEKKKDQSRQKYRESDDQKQKAVKKRYRSKSRSPSSSQSPPPVRHKEKKHKDRHSDKLREQGDSDKRHKHRESDRHDDTRESDRQYDERKSSKHSSNKQHKRDRHRDRD